MLTLPQRQKLNKLDAFLTECQRRNKLAAERRKFDRFIFALAGLTAFLALGLAIALHFSK